MACQKKAEEEKEELGHRRFQGDADENEEEDAKEEDAESPELNYLFKKPGNFDRVSMKIQLQGPSRVYVDTIATLPALQYRQWVRTVDFTGYYRGPTLRQI